LIQRLVLEEIRNPESLWDLIYIRVLVDLDMQAVRKGFDPESTSQARGIVYSNPVTLFKPGKPTIREKRHLEFSIFRYLSPVFNSF
jgi:hypothetical protein